MKLMQRWRQLSRVLLIGLFLMVWGTVLSPSAQALTPIALKDLSYHECSESLSQGIVTPGSMNPANCFIVTGTAVNASARPVVDADIFGRIFDADNNPVMQNRNRLGSIPYVPLGESAFELRISVPDKMRPPLRLENFKASGFAGSVGQFGNIDEAEFDEFSEDTLE
ncbi:hypothetical protein [Lyngbya confervoides]|uniref:Biotin carboxylase n=1 Tax=Lyngbya confervoides BDU141951 TaxID=1574623 RepID=A0ABD4T6Z0_9CYAN|nr:hypothetical protein [Lyngbya confervoides]MCM1984236.1 hypothetical protein [Lyngbya confervoides BDU141951]